MPQSVRAPMQRVQQEWANLTDEIRLRVNRPISLVIKGEIRYLCNDGSLQSNPDSAGCCVIRKNEIDSIVAALCRFSVHSCTRELTEAFFTIENGVRVGVGGTYSSSKCGVIKYVNSLNFRIAREVIGCAHELYQRIFASGLRSVLICGGVNSGKTTLLRDLCRLCGNSYKVALIDERSELAASVSGVPTNDIGTQTDLLEGCRRSEGIVTAIRTLSPQIIFSDEISTEEDAGAILQGSGCGVNFAATIHAKSINDLTNRLAAQKLLSEGVFDYAVLLESSGVPGKIKEIRRLSRNV